MTTSRNGKRAASIHPQNALSINPALLWLASLTPAGRRGMQSLLRRCAGILRPGAKPDTPHDLRRTFITRLLEQGVDINVVRQLAGHADISTTTRYDCRGRQAVDRASRALCCW